MKEQLTREQILNMETGREMDALIMEKVMGKTIVKRAELIGWPGRYVYDPESSHLTPDELYWMNNQQHGEWELVGPEYSLDLSAAWRVVEQFAIVDIQFVEWFIGNKSTTVKISMPIDEENFEVYEATARTAPEAICKAALLTTLEEVKA